MYAKQLVEGPDALKVHELVEVYGVLERAPETFLEEGESIDWMAQEAAAERNQRPPPSAQPRVHVIKVRRLPDAHGGMLPKPTTNAEAALFQTARCRISQLRDAVLSSLSKCLGGDVLAAEYILLAVTSRIMYRHGESPIGKLHVNITGCPEASTDQAFSPVTTALQTCLGQLVPSSTAQAMSVRALNEAQLVPEKDHEANCIWPAKLQLPAGSVLLLDEAMLAPGMLQEKGVRNMQALASIVEAQTVPYNFTYCSINFPVDVRLPGPCPEGMVCNLLTALSSGNVLQVTVISVSSSKSMLPISCQVPLQVALTAEPDEHASQTEAGLLLRQYIGLAALMQHRLTSIASEVAKVAEDEFVAARQADPSVSAEDFARLLTCTRLLAASSLAPDVTFEHYQHAKTMEAARLARLNSSEVAV